MSMSNLSVDGEFRYIIQWFNEWSELQRDDFVYVLVDYLGRDTSVSTGEDERGCGSTYVNGVVNSMATSGVQDKPMSLFQCRIKLFREWSPKWPIEFKYKLQEKINEIDPKVGDKIINELKTPHSTHNGEVAVNLNVNGNSGIGHNEVEQSIVDPETLPTAIEMQAAPDVAAVVIEALPAAVNNVTEQIFETVNDNHLAAVLRQETPVDDDDVDQLVGNDCNVDTIGIYASSAGMTTVAVNTSPSEQPQSQPGIEPVEQVENNASASVIVTAAAAVPEVIPVA